MKIQEIESVLNESRGNEVIRQLVGEFNAEVSGDVHIPMTYKDVGFKVWTRGDGTRYRDPGLIMPYQYGSPAFYKKWDKATTVRKFWDWLSARPGVRSVGQVSGEFGSGKMRDAVTLGKIYFALTQHNSIEWGSSSRFKNPNSVWRHKPGV